jgi:hypothetical protein
MIITAIIFIEAKSMNLLVLNRKELCMKHNVLINKYPYAIPFLHNKILSPQKKNSLYAYTRRSPVDEISEKNAEETARL